MINSSLKTLFLTRYLVYPPLGGSALRNWQNINIMQKYGPVGVFSAGPGVPDNTTIEGLDFWQHYNTQRPLSRWEQLERKLWPLRPLAYPNIDQYYAPEAAKKLAEILQQFQPNLVIVAELFLYRYLRQIQRYSCPIIFDNHNIEADLFEQNYGIRRLQLPRLKAIEGKFMNQADQVWVCSDDDVKLAKKLYGNQPKIYSIPNSINVKDYEQIRLKQCPLPQDLEPRKHDILFLGQYNYPPNAIAAKIILEEIYPPLKQRYPDCRLLLVGRNANSSMFAAAKNDPNIIVTGSVPDVKPYVAAASVMIVPLQTGGGTRLKILEALASSCPVVSTTKGVEGINATDGIHLLIRDTPQAMVEGVCQIWSNLSLATSLADKAYELVKNQYSWEATAPKIDQLIQVL